LTAPTGHPRHAKPESQGSRAWAPRQRRAQALGSNLSPPG
jgi:hypothetical protein